MARKSRRDFLKGAAAAAGAAAALPAATPAAAGPAPAPAAPRWPEGVSPTGEVCFVNADRRHILGRVIGVGPEGRLRVEYAARPTRDGVESVHRVTLSRRDEPDMRHLPRPFTWHRIATPEEGQSVDRGCSCGRPYSEWWYGRTRRELAETIDPRPGQHLADLAQGTGWSPKPEGVAMGVVVIEPRPEVTLRAKQASEWPAPSPAPLFDEMGPTGLDWRRNE